MAGSGDDSLVGGVRGDAMSGATGHDTFFGGGGNDVMSGGDDNDSMSGGAGDDVLQGDGDDDTLIGGEGADRLIGGDGTDTASYAGSNAGVVASLGANGGSGGSASRGHAEGDTLREIENLIGSDHNDTLTGDGGDNTLEGGAGRDRINGGAGSDTASYAGSNAGVSVDLSVSGHVIGSGGHADRDTLEGIENLIGSAHGDTLVGGSGASMLEGGGGADVLTGNGGADVFVFVAAGSDTVTDFQDGIDRIRITTAGIDSFTDDITVADAGDNATISWGGGSITLEGVDHNLLAADDFIFGLRPVSTS